MRDAPMPAPNKATMSLDWQLQRLVSFALVLLFLALPGDVFRSSLFIKPSSGQDVSHTVVAFMTSMFEERPLSLFQGNRGGPGLRPRCLVFDGERVLDHFVRDACETLGQTH